MSDPSPDNAVPFLAHLTPFDAHSAVDTAYEFIDEISARDGGDVLLLALAIGCLCVEITKLNGGERDEGGQAPKRWERVR